MSNKKLDYPSTEKFRVIDTIGVPHPYCITPKHVAYAADNCGGMLGEAAMRGAEKAGAKCGICKENGSSLTYDEHKQALLIQVNDRRELKQLSAELQPYLLSIKQKAEAEGYVGFAFKQSAGAAS